MVYEIGTGATALGIKLDNGVVLAAEKKFSYGGFVMSRSVKKIFRIHDRIAIAAAGLFADMQTISRIISNEIRYYEISSKHPISVRGAAKQLSVILYSYKYMPFLTELVIGGIDHEGSHIYVMDPVGSLIEDDYAAVGTGAQIAIGLLEDKYNKNMSLEEAVKLAVEAIRIASKRDTMSGEGVDVAVITKDSYEEKYYPIR
ncbi:MAG: archaeal proteasome endopeptidase complex subunit beta [Desulfurococcales archaeon]|nr:archaeal proteasome endopeptidase complex subunit beta [Desulfurococcales archaeon]